jgi:hypothetical protein
MPQTGIHTLCPLPTSSVGQVYQRSDCGMTRKRRTKGTSRIESYHWRKSVETGIGGELAQTGLAQWVNCGMKRIC